MIISLRQTAIAALILTLGKSAEAIATPKTSSTRLFASDPTALFNADILRIASRTTTKHANFNPIHAADHAHRMLVQMIDMQTSERKTAKPNTETVRIVLKAFANLGGAQWDDAKNYNDASDKGSEKVNAVDRMENILIRWNDFQLQDSEDVTVQLTTDVLNLILKAYARCGYQKIPPKSLNGESKIDEKLPWLEPLSDRGCYAERAEKLLNYMRRASSDSSIAPNAQSYAYVVQAWSRQQPSAKMFMMKSKSRGAFGNDMCAARASKWLPLVETHYENEKEADSSTIGNIRRNARRILIWAYSDALDAWARSGTAGAAKNANECMTRIEELSVEDVDEVQQIKEQKLANIHRVTEDDNKEKGQGNFYGQPNVQLFDEKDVFLHPECPLFPSDQSYTSAILAMSRSREKGAARRAHQLLNRMLKLYDSGEWVKNRPNIVTFNSVISAYANSPEPGSADKAENVLNQLENLYFDEEKHQYNYLKPDVITYNSVVSAWCKCKEEAAVYNAENIVKRMEKRYDAVGVNFLDVSPDSYTYVTLINGWIRSGLGVTAADNAEIILRLMIERFQDGDDRCLPNQKTFCQIINAWGQCADGEDFPVRRAMALLDLMEELYNDGIRQLKPDMITYSSLIDTIAKSRLPNGSDLAFDLIEKIENLYLSGDTTMKPNAKTYSGVFLSLINSQQEGKHLKAQQVLDRMKKLKVDINAFSYNYAINCASSVVDESDNVKMEAFKIALKAFSSLRKSSYETDSFSYNFFLKACRLLPSSTMRSKVVRETFQECCSQGKLNNEVLSRLSACLDPSEIRNLVSSGGGDVRNISVENFDPKYSLKAKKKRVNRSY
jgi:hypothetical protein